MIIVEILGLILRLAELAFAAIVAGVTGTYLHEVDTDNNDDSAWYHARFIYAIVVAAISMLFALIWLIPFIHRILHWPLDILMSILWFVAFGLIVDFIGDDCGAVFNWDGIRLRGRSSCSTWKADIAFSFLSAICWLASAVVGFYIIRRREAPVDRAARRRGWGRRSHV